MVSSWMLSRFRSAWLSQNLALLVLRLLRESSQNEWEILYRLHSRYGFSPAEREFWRSENSIVEDGYASMEPGPGGRLRITSAGLGLLLRLEEEHRSVVSNVVRPHRRHGNGLAP